jgi:hypothetical protein
VPITTNVVSSNPAHAEVYSLQSLSHEYKVYLIQVFKHSEKKPYIYGYGIVAQTVLTLTSENLTQQSYI